MKKLFTILAVVALTTPVHAGLGSTISLKRDINEAKRAAITAGEKVDRVQTQLDEMRRILLDLQNRECN